MSLLAASGYNAGVVIQAIVFDYFGVIEPDALWATYSYFGGDPERDARLISDTIYAANSGRIAGSRYIFAERLGVTVEEWMQALHERRGKDPAVLEYILELKKAYKTGLLSNVGRGGLELLWGKELSEYFDAAIASGDVGIVKPDRRIFRLMAERLGTRPGECVLLDDNPDFCQGARESGMRAIHFRHLRQCKRELGQLLERQAT